MTSLLKTDHSRRYSKFPEYFSFKRNVRSYRVLANKVCGQESPVGPTHDKHVWRIYLSAFQNFHSNTLKKKKTQTRFQRLRIKYADALEIYSSYGTII